MIRVVVGLMLVIAGASALDGPAELIMQRQDNSDWVLFTLLTSIGLPCMLWGALSINRHGRG